MTADRGTRKGPVVGEAITLAPPVGALFEYRGSGYRVSSFLKPAPEPDFKALDDPDFDFRRDGLGQVLYDAQQKVGPDKCRLVWCSREEAVYVSGSGICGCVARVTDIVVTGMVGWSADTLRQAEDSARRLIGERLW